MIKDILKLKEAKELNKAEQIKVNGGFGPSEVVCNSPQFNAGSTCPPGTSPHPTHGVCICCAN